METTDQQANNQPQPSIQADEGGVTPQQSENGQPANSVSTKTNELIENSSKIASKEPDESNIQEQITINESANSRDEHEELDEDEELQLIDQDEGNQQEQEGQQSNENYEKKEDENAMEMGEEPEVKSIEVEENLESPVETSAQMKRLILTNGQLKRLNVLDIASFRKVAIGFYVRVNVQGLPSKYANYIFLDQIVDVLEVESFQHLWLKRRLRLNHLGDFSLDQVVPNKVKDEYDLLSWFHFMQAKEEVLPTLGFVHQKESHLAEALLEVEKADTAKLAEPSSKIRRDDLGKVILNPTSLRNLSKLGFESFREAVKGCFVSMPCICRDKPMNCQYHIVKVKDVVRGSREYTVSIKTYNLKVIVAKIDYQLELAFYGKYIVNWVKNTQPINEEGFRLWLEDMRNWKEPLPTVDYIRTKAAALQIALAEAEKTPNLEDQEKQRIAEEERARRAKLPATCAKDLEPCTLTRPLLQKLVQLEDGEMLAKVLTGCFLRLNAGAANNFEIDQIVSVELSNEPETGEETTEPASGRKKKQAETVLKLKVTGTISCTPLTYIASNFKFSEEEFRKSWLAETNEDDPLPIIETIQQKQKEIETALKLIAELQQQKNNAQAKGDEKAADSDIVILSPPEKPASNGTGRKRAASAELQGGDEEAAKNEENPKTETQGSGLSSVRTKDGQLTPNEMKKIILSTGKMLELMTMEKDTLVRVLRNYFARVAANRPEKPKSLQYYLDEITGVSWGGNLYRIRGRVLTDIRLHFRHMGNRTFLELYRSDANTFFNADALQMFVDDMKEWNEPLPTLALIEKKAREFDTAQRRKNVSSAYGSTTVSRTVSAAPRARPFVTTMQRSGPPMAPPMNSRYQSIQSLVAQNVRATPGIAAGWTQQTQSFMMPQQQQWNQQSAAFAGAGPSPFSPEKESWRIAQQRREMEAAGIYNYSAVDDRGSFGPAGGGLLGSSAGSIGSLRDFRQPIKEREYEVRRSYEQQQQMQTSDLYRRPSTGPSRESLLPSSFSSLTPSVAMQHYNTATRGPSSAKRQRQHSPQPPAVQRFF